MLHIWEKNKPTCPISNVQPPTEKSRWLKVFLICTFSNVNNCTYFQITWDGRFEARSKPVEEQKTTKLRHCWGNARGENLDTLSTGFLHRHLPYISTYINTKMFVCVCVFVFSRFSRPFRNRLGNHLTQCFILLSKVF